MQYSPLTSILIHGAVGYALGYIFASIGKQFHWPLPLTLTLATVSMLGISLLLRGWGY